MTRPASLVLTLLLFVACAPAADIGPDDVEARAEPIAEAQALSLEQALSEQDRLVAAFREGALGAPDFLTAMAAFADHPDPEAVIGSTRMLPFIHAQFPDLRPGLARHIRRTYGARYRMARTQDGPDADRLSANLGALMAYEGNDQEARNYLVRQGSIYLGLDGDDPDLRATVPGHLLDSAFAATMRARPVAALGPLLALTKSGTEAERRAAILGLAAVQDDQAAERLLETLMSDDPDLTPSQRQALLSAMMRNPSQIERAWNGLRDNFESFVDLSVPKPERGKLPSWTSAFCSVDRANEVRAFFGSDPGPSQALATALTDIEGCARTRSLQEASLRSALGD
ncbi:MAG: ERAP1-like C-terminal domain-containing protein [Pseudomonadota bacterium]